MTVYARAKLTDQSYIDTATGVQNAAFLYGTPLAQESYDYYDSLYNEGTNYQHYGNPAKDGSNGNGFSAIRRNGNLFAGWYVSRTGTSIEDFPSNNKPAMTGIPRYPFGWFVSKDTQNVIVQQSAVSKKNNTYALRIMSTIPSSDIKNFNFKVNLKYSHCESGNCVWNDSKTYDFTTSKAYVKATANGLSEASVTPLQYGKAGDGKYWVAAYITGLPVTEGISSPNFVLNGVDVTPTWTTADGTAVSRGTLTDVEIRN